MKKMTRKEPPMAPEKDRLKDHQFDGIQEYDNPIPLWLNLIFVGTVCFALPYMLWYHVFDKGVLPVQAYEAEMAEVQKAREAQAQQAPSLDVAALAADAAAREAGAQIFASTCASCHGPTAEGLVGPNLRDHAWRNGDGSLAAIINIVTNGVPAKGMPPWKMLGPEKIHQVAAFVYSLSTPNGDGSPHPDAHPETPPAQ
ncbi:MAG: hypothetical protein D6761_01120 [Candidatus Dadabacteria bacterium]|nr:MAG: hypothetical protein D6761_01120 [Candidatus Dadabacteria bacterium]